MDEITQRTTGSSTDKDIDNFFTHLIERLILFVGGFKIFFELLEASGINKIDLF